MRKRGRKAVSVAGPAAARSPTYPAAFDIAPSLMQNLLVPDWLGDNTDAGAGRDALPFL